MESDVTNPLPLVAIGVATHKRPRYLRELLQSIRKVELDQFCAHLIVADNDPRESARPIVEGFVDSFPIPISYVVERERGIASARNRIVREAEELDAEYLAFVDDDTVVEPNWLRELVKVARTTPVAAVVGDMGRWIFEPGVPDWAKRSNFWKPGPGRTSGTKVRHFGTKNVLFRLSDLKQIPGPFDVRRNLTGGSDLVLSDCLYRRGLQSVWCAESIVHEHVPASRATASWMIRRGWRYGLNYGYLCREYEQSHWRKIAFVLGAFVRAAKHSSNLILGIPRGRAGIVPPLAYLASSFGRIAGLLGVSYEEYRVTHGQ